MLDVWSGARGWLTPPVLFVFVNVVIGTIAVMSKLMSSSPAAPGADKAVGQRSLMRAPSAAFDRFRCFSFSRLGLPAEQHAPLFDDDGLAEAPLPAHVQPAPGGFERRASFLRAPSFARLRGFSFSRRGPAADDDHAAPVTPQPPADAEPSRVRSAPAVARMELEREPAAHIERSQSEAAVEAPARRRRAKKTRKSATAEASGVGEAVRVDAGAGRQLLPPAVEVNERADDFIRQFREQLRLQRLDSILRSRDALRRTGTC